MNIKTILSAEYGDFTVGEPCQWFPEGNEPQTITSIDWIDRHTYQVKLSDGRKLNVHDVRIAELVTW